MQKMAQCLKFIISGKEDDNICLDVLHKAAEQAITAEIDVEWLNIKDLVNRKSLDAGTVLVCETFEGEIFDRLRSMGLKIVGPLCVTSCLKNVQPLPQISEPVHNIAMLDVVACCTNVPVARRNKLKDLIVMMGGIMVGDFTHSVTHLIAGEVGSKKYIVACEIGIKIMQPSWVQECWERNQCDFIDANDDRFKKHLCPCFKGLTICVTGLSAEARQEIKMLTEKNGGKYSGELNMRTCTHLIVRFAKGEKYNYAKQWRIHCISPQWFFDCVKSGFCREEKSYKIEKGDDSVFEESRFLNSSQSRVDMTVQSDVDTTIASTKAAAIAAKRIKSREEEKPINAENETRFEEDFMKTADFKLKSFDTSKLDIDGLNIKMSDSFLDGCKFFVSGIPQHVMDYLRKIINAVGAMRFSQLNESISHIILGDSVSKDIKEFLENNVQKPYVVSPEWLINCYNKGKHLNEQGRPIIYCQNNQMLCCLTIFKLDKLVYSKLCISV